MLLPQSDQFELLIGDKKQIDLPEICTPVVKTPCGVIRQVLSPASRQEIATDSAIQMSPRRKERVLGLNDGRRIILTPRRSCALAPGVDGILHHARQNGGIVSWIVAPATAAMGHQRTREAVRDSWNHTFHYSAEQRDRNGELIHAGLRYPQIGALHAIGAHWSLTNELATVVMPTGTGKTETMLAALLAYRCDCLLIVVPSVALREQTADKFLRLGVLRHTGNVDEPAINPIVGVLTRRPRDIGDLAIFEQCNVVIGTVNTVAQGAAAGLGEQIAARCSHLILDEAHHAEANTWSDLRRHFKTKPVLQFTATPHREDGKIIEGRIIYDYPLARAQRDGFFKTISFEGVFETDSSLADKKIAEAAVTKLRSDLADGFDHLLMARCRNKKRAAEVFDIYRELAPDLAPVLIHSGLDAVKGVVRAIRAGHHRIIVCVNMLAEGFDLPQLKIAAVHDKHKSLGVLLQFVGRFTRTAQANLGRAHIVANTGVPDVADALERLYSENPDWNELLAEFSFSLIQQQRQLLEFLRDSKRLAPDEGHDDAPLVALKSLTPKHSAVIHEVDRFTPFEFHKAIEAGIVVQDSWFNERRHVLTFVTRGRESLTWCDADGVSNRLWNIYVVYHDEKRGLLFIHSSEPDTLHQELAAAVSGNSARLFSGEKVFRCLGNIRRLIFQQIGLMKHGRRNLRYSMYSGSDVVQALTATERQNSTRSNVFGMGYDGGKPARVGCSRKGKIWSRGQGAIESFVVWCDEVGAKLRDDSINTESIIDNVLIPTIVSQVPLSPVLHIDWPQEIAQLAEERIRLISPALRFPIYVTELSYRAMPNDRGYLEFAVVGENLESSYRLLFSGTNGYHFEHVGGPILELEIGTKRRLLTEYFDDYPPVVLFVDGSELHGCDHFPLKEPGGDFSVDQLHPRAWDNVDILVESAWAGTVHRPNSIQQRAIELCLAEGFEVVFNDDDSGEAADVVCIRERNTEIDLRLVHCKFSSKAAPGSRIKDVIEVAAQVSKSVRWFWRFDRLCRHLQLRETRKAATTMRSRFLRGDLQTVHRLARVSRFKPVIGELIAVQPGISLAQLTHDQRSVLAAADSYVRDTTGLKLQLWCSA